MNGLNVVLTGATGFLGRALTLVLRREGHRVVALVRSVETARARLGDQAELIENDADGSDDVRLRAALERCDAVVNLAGAPVLSRWTAARRAELRASRVGLTQRLVRAIERTSARPRVLVSASAVGFYGDRGDEPLTEESRGGTGFLAQLCAEWEAAALGAEELGVRVVLVRTGVVLGLDGGALPKLLPVFRIGLGGRLGSGRQSVPWIHVEDWARLIVAALDDPRFGGPVNATGPEPASQHRFARMLAATLRRPAWIPTPAIALRATLGGAASILLESQRALPARAQALGFRFRFATLAAALRDLLVGGRVAIRPPTADSPDSPYLEKHSPKFELRATTEVRAPLAETFRFFSSPENLGLLTPLAMRFTIAARHGAPAAGSTVDYRIRVGPLTLRWRTRFEAWEAGARFVDVQESGPYRCWWHEHRFEAADSVTRMHDRVLFAPPLGLLGRLAQRCFITTALRDLFAQRALAIRLRFSRDRGPDQLPFPIQVPSKIRRRGSVGSAETST